MSDDKSAGEAVVEAAAEAAKIAAAAQAAGMPPEPQDTAAGAAARAAAEAPVRAIAAELQSKFSLPEGALKVQRATRLWVEVDKAGFAPVFDHLVKSMGFSILCTITGLDLGTDLGFIYHLARDGGIMANVKTRVPKGETMKSVTPYFLGAAIYESELEDLLGAHIDGKPQGPRYPLPEDWPQGNHPLLKDWKAQTPGETAVAPEAAEGAADV